MLPFARHLFPARCVVCLSSERGAVRLDFEARQESIRDDRLCGARVDNARDHCAVASTGQLQVGFHGVVAALVGIRGVGSHGVAVEEADRFVRTCCGVVL